MANGHFLGGFDRTPLAIGLLKRANKDTLRQALASTDWDTIIGNENKIENANNNFLEAVIKAAKIVGVPKHKTKAQEKNKETTIGVLLSERNKICTQLENTHNLRGKDRYLELKQLNGINNDLQLLITNEKVINEINLNTKTFFNYANKNRKSKSKIGPLKQGNTFESGPQKMADILSMQYRSVFSKPKTDLTNLKFKSISSPNMEDTELTKEDFQEVLKNLDPSSAPGPDNIPAFFYKDYAE